MVISIFYSSKESILTSLPYSYVLHLHNCMLLDHDRDTDLQNVCLHVYPTWSNG